MREHVSKKSRTVCSAKLSRLEFVFLPIVDQLQPNFNKVPCVEQRIAKLDKKVPFVVILFIYIIYIRQ